jgi:protoheme IX farnesyltransferase
LNSNAAAVVITPVTLRGRASAYLELTKPRVVTMILITALAGFYMGSGAEFDFVLALKVLCGTALAAGGTLALNQYLERDCDAMMNRTCARPLPSGRLQPREALTFGLVIGLAGIMYLCVAVNPLSALVTGVISLLYLGGYTPMKRFSWLCHMVGGVPGALPPVIGWTAARGTLGAEPFVLFGIMLLWQLPHSLSIARIYQADYARAGLSLLPLDRPGGNPVNAVMIIAAGLLVGFGTIPTWMGFAGKAYMAVALLLGLWMLYGAVRLVSGNQTAAAARNVMMVSLVYLPAVLLMMVLDKA